jgi:Methyltransferase domain
MDKIDPEEVAKKYNSIEVIWDVSDKWHLWTKRMINDFIKNSLVITPNYQNIQILNAGSAGYSYGLDEKNILHIDIAKDRISHLPNSLVADIHKIPIQENYFGLIICVGSVINYCEPMIVMEEFNRLLSSNGHLILEFENSYTLELLGKSSFNKKATLIDTFYKSKPEKIWFFSEAYIKELAELSGLKLLSIRRCHIISPLVYRIFKNERFAARFGVLDELLSSIPVLKRFSSNTICLFTKTN